MPPATSVHEALSAVLDPTASVHLLEARDSHIPAAVLVGLHGSEDELRVVLTERRRDLRRHAGEISFPGGRRDPEDASLADTALREAEEEIGLSRKRVRLLGALTRTSTFVTNYSIHPFVGIIDAPGRWRAANDEVAEVIEPTLSELLAARGRTEITRRGFTFETDAYLLEGRVVWGATARILEDLLTRVVPLLNGQAGS